MDLTVCVCTHDRPRYVRDCLAGLRRQTIARDRFAVLIVDSSSPEPARSELRELVLLHPGARLIQVDEPGVSAARNAGAAAAGTDYIAYLDDDAIPAADWVMAILGALAAEDRPPAVLGGRILPIWEAKLPAWWPPGLRGVLSIVEHEGQGEYRTAALPANLEPFACNMVVHVRSLLDSGGFGCGIGRVGPVLLSDEDVQLAWRLQSAGLSVRYDSRIVVFHQIQAIRLTPDWLLARLYWQGASTVLSRRLSSDGGMVWRELPRRLLVATLCAPAALWPRTSTRLLAIRWRWAYAAGFVRAALGWRATDAARREARGVSPWVASMILYQWHGEAPNFGDELNSLIWPRLLPNFFDQNEDVCFLGIGSGLDARHDPAGTKLVAGAGYGGYSAPATLDETWIVHWVRGPRTAQGLGLPPGLGLGDPASLLPLAGFTPAREARSVGFMPHFESASRGAWLEASAAGGVTMIDPRADPLTIIAAIGQCRVMMSEALHGIIVADALRVPWIALRPLAAIHRSKWIDWAESLDLSIEFRDLAASTALEKAYLTRLSRYHVGRNMLRRSAEPLRGIARGRFIERAARSLQVAADMEPRLSPGASLDRACSRMMEAIAAMRRTPMAGWRHGPASRRLRHEAVSAYLAARGDPAA